MIEANICSALRWDDCAETRPDCSRVKQIISRLRLLSVGVFMSGFSPFDCAFEVWLADGAVVYEDGGTGAVLLR